MWGKEAMPRKLLLSIIVVLMITNITTLLFLKKDGTSPVKEQTPSTDEQKPIDQNEPVATIGKEEISYTDWVEETRKTHGERQLKSMIDRSVVKQLAEQEGIKVDEKVIDREVAFLTTMQGVKTAAEIKELEASWREDVIYRYELEALLTKGVDIPEDKIKQHFNGYKAQYNFDTSIQASHIIVDNTDIADKVIKELEQGASFDLLAQEYSKDEESKDDGGYLGFLVEGSQFFPYGYEDIIKDMSEDSYSEPTKLGNNVVIIYLHRRLPEITFTYDEVKPYIKNELALDEMEQTLTAKPLWEKFDIDWIFEGE